MKDTHLRHEPFFSVPPVSVSIQRTRRANGAPLSLPASTAPSLPTSKIEAATALLSRIKQLEAENRRLRHLCITDELTGAYNRRHFRASFTDLVHVPSSPLPRTTAIALCLFDVDHFKAYNDAFGHPMGDAALRSVSMAVGALLKRESDRLFRFGGDEFGALFRAPAPEHAMQFAEQFQAAIRGLRLSHPNGSNDTLSATFGIAWHPDPARHRINAKQLYSAADNTLYEAKHGGRNCILMRIMHDAEHPDDIPRRVKSPAPN